MTNRKGHSRQPLQAGVEEGPNLADAVEVTYFQRELSTLARRALRTFPVVVVTGLRQAGKTTFLRQDNAFAGRRYVTLDDFAALEAARLDPESLLRGEEPITIDEVQRCPELLVAIKRAVDEQRTPGRFVLSGSANLSLRHGVTESLAGRAMWLTLGPFTRRERLGAIQEPFLVTLLREAQLPPPGSAPTLTDEEVLYGGMPPIVVGGDIDRDLWLLGYEQTYLERDVRDLAQIGDLVTFRTVLRLAAARTGQLLNQSVIARDAKLPVSTAVRYMGLLETSFILNRLPPFMRSRTTRLLKSPKIFLTDSALACHLTATSDVGVAADEPLRGPLYETFVYQNLAGMIGAHLPDAELGFWSIQARHEVDFVISHKRRRVAIEVKAASRFGERDLAGLRAFRDKTPGALAGILAYNGSEAFAPEKGLFVVPLGLLLS